MPQSRGRYKDDFKRLYAAFQPIMGDYLRIGINEVWSNGEFSHLWAEIQVENQSMMELIEAGAPMPSGPDIVTVDPGWNFTRTETGFAYFGQKHST